MARDKLVLKGLAFHGHHGYHPEEAALGARFIVDVEMTLALDEVEDELAHTVNYADVYACVAREVTSKRYRLIEALANHIAARLWASYPQLEALTVRVHKPHAPLPGVFRDLYVEVNRAR